MFRASKPTCCVSINLKIQMSLSSVTGFSGFLEKIGSQNFKAILPIVVEIFPTSQLARLQFELKVGEMNLMNIETWCC